MIGKPYSVVLCNIKEIIMEDCRSSFSLPPNPIHLARGMAAGAIPYESFTDGEAIAYYVLCALGFLLAVISFVVQSQDSAPYGRHFSEEKAWGFMVSQ